MILLSPPNPNSCTRMQQVEEDKVDEELAESESSGAKLFPWVLVGEGVGSGLLLLLLLLAAIMCGLWARGQGKEGEQEMKEVQVV